MHACFCICCGCALGFLAVLAGLLLRSCVRFGYTCRIWGTHARFVYVRGICLCMQKFGYLFRHFGYACGFFGHTCGMFALHAGFIVFFKDSGCACRILGVSAVFGSQMALFGHGCWCWRTHASFWVCMRYLDVGVP